MADTTFDTLSASRDLKAAGIEDQHAAAIVNAISQSVGRSVTVDRFDAGIGDLGSRVDTGLTELRAHVDTGLTELRTHVDTGLTELRAHVDTGLTELRAHVDTGLTELRAHVDTGLTELRTHVDTGLTELRAENARAMLIYAGVIIGANAFVVTVAGIVLAASLSA